MSLVRLAAPRSRLVGILGAAVLMLALVPAPVQAAADNLYISSAVPANQVSGTQFSITVQARVGTAVDPTFTGTVHVTSTDPAAVLPADYTYTGTDAGVHTFSVTLKTAGAQTVTFASASPALSVTSSSINVTASKLVLTGGPVSTIAGNQFGVPIAAQDATSATATNFTGVVTVTSSDLQMTVTPTSPYTFVGGDAGVKTFQVTLKTAGSQTVTFSSPGLTSATLTVAVSAAAASKLVFTQQPSSSTTGTAFPTQPWVAVTDAYGNVITTDSSTQVTLSLAVNPSSAALSCTQASNTMTVTSGVAKFTGCSVNKIGLGYRLGASSNPSYTAATSNTFDIPSGPATKLAFCWTSAATCVATPPTDSKGGLAFSLQPSVRVQDAAGNLVTTDSSTTITLSILSGTPVAGGPGTLTCTGGLSLRVTSGVANYTGCAIDKVGTAYRLQATSSPVFLAALSSSFNVAAGAPVALAFTVQPSGGPSRAAWTGQPVVAIVDAGGNTVTSTNATISLAIQSNPGSGTLSCTGGNYLGTNSGVAAFTGCSIDNQGTGYTLVATAPSVSPYVYLPSIVSNPFNIVAPAAQITLSVSASVITWSQPVTLTVQFGTNGANKPFALQTSPDMVNWTTIPTAPTTTNASGTATFTWTPARNFWYRAVFAGTPDLSAANSNVVRVVVRQIALLRPTLGGKVKTIANGTSITFTTTVRPARPELPKAKVTFTFQLYRAGHLVYNGKRDVYIDSLGLAKWTWKFGTSGEWYVRAIANPTTANANSVWSQIEHYHVP